MMNTKNENEALCFCPECGKESFYVKVQDSGISVHPEFGEDHWFSGIGHCSECNHTSFYSDGSL